MNPPLLIWASQNPWLAFGLAFPVMWMLVCVCASFANSVVTLWSITTTTFTHALNVLTIWMRGYPSTSQPAVLSEHIGPDSASDEMRPS